MPSSTNTRGGTIAAVSFRCQSQRNLRIRHGQVGTTISMARWTLHSRRA